MIVLLGDGKGQPIRLPASYLAVYDNYGRLIYAADQLGENKLRQANPLDNPNDPDLADIVKTNGLPFRPLKDVTSSFSLAEGTKVFKPE